MRWESEVIQATRIRRMKWPGRSDVRSGDLVRPMVPVSRCIPGISY